MHLDARWYNPQTTRFIQPDLWNFASTGLPKEIQHEVMQFAALNTSLLLSDPGQQMRYGYVANNPSSWMDLMGLCYPETHKVDPISVSVEDGQIKTTYSDRTGAYYETTESFEYEYDPNGLAKLANVSIAALSCTGGPAACAAGAAYAANEINKLNTGEDIIKNNIETGLSTVMEKETAEKVADAFDYLLASKSIYKSAKNILNDSGNLMDLAVDILDPVVNGVGDNAE